MRRNRRVLVLAAAVVAAVLVSAGWLFKSRIERGRVEISLKPLAERSPVAEFQLETSDGFLKSADLRGRPALLAVWASWCGPCIEEIPQLIDLQKSFAERLAVVGLNVDSEGWPAVERVKAAFPEINYTIALPSPRPLILGTIVNLEPLGQVSVLPTAFLLDGRGRLAAKYVGSAPLAQVRADIEALLEEEKR